MQAREKLPRVLFVHNIRRKVRVFRLNGSFAFPGRRGGRSLIASFPIGEVISREKVGLFLPHMCLLVFLIRPGVKFLDNKLPPCVSLQTSSFNHTQLHYFGKRSGRLDSHLLHYALEGERNKISRRVASGASIPHKYAIARASATLRSIIHDRHLPLS